jgi:uncharacterized membrane protein
MRRRLYFMLPDIDVACQVEDELLLARIPESRMHFLSRRGMDMRTLHTASFLQKTDFIHSIAVGAGAGAATGLVMGGILYINPEFAEALGTSLIAVMAVVGTLFGMWAASMIGISTPNIKLRKYQKAMEDGQVLLMVDIPKHRVDEISTMLSKHHPDAVYHGIDARIPAFP